jgi:hypothetical protein
MPGFPDDRFEIHDDVDHTKRVRVDVSGVTTNTRRTLTVPNYSGIPATPATEGTAAQVLTSAGAGVQPTWTTLAAGGVTKGQATVAFGSAGSEQATVTVADAAIGAASRIVCNMAYTAAPGRDLDELEMDQFELKPGNIAAGVSFDILATCLTGYGEGNYLVDYHYS